MVADGMTTQEILVDLPDLEVDDVTEALRFAADELRERHLPLRPFRMKFAARQQPCIRR